MVRSDEDVTADNAVAAPSAIGLKPPLSFTAWACFGAWALGIALTAAYHELGTDESQAWNIARAAALPWQVFQYSAYEGHMPTWFLLLWPFALSGEPALMQLVSATIVLVVGVVLLRDRPFPRLVNLLVLFGYLLFYDFAIISRPYSLALLSVALWSTLLRNDKGGMVTRALPCMVLAWTSAFGVVLSLPLMLVVWLESFARSEPPAIGRRVVSVALYALACLSAVALIVLPLNHYSQMVISGGVASPPSAFVTLVTAAFPNLDRLPFGIGTWASESVAGQLVSNIAAVLVALCVAVRLSSRPSALAGWLTCLVVLPSAVAFADAHAERHLGHLFLGALALCWARDGLRWHARPQPSATRLRRLADGVLLAVLFYHAVVGIGASLYDIRHEMTPYKRAAAELTPLIQEDTVIINDFIPYGVPLLAYLDREAWDTYCDCFTRYNDQQHRRKPPPERLRLRWCEMLAQGKDVLVLTPRNDIAEADGASVVAEYPPAIRDTSRGGAVIVKASDPAALCS